jgi:hypothetical protein
VSNAAILAADFLAFLQRAEYCSVEQIDLHVRKRLRQRAIGGIAQKVAKR